MLDIKALTNEMTQTLSHLKEELKKLRVGRANPDLIKDIKVEAYSTMMPMEQVANINVADATLLTVQPWDKTIIQSVVKAIQTSELGINPSVDGDLIRIPIPPLTQERREEYVKIMKQKLEEAKISVRQKRKEFIDGLESNKGASEDEIERDEKELQKIIDSTNSQIEEIGEAKEKDLLQV
ncbi:MAG TPA: ribosome recycling factor [Candidatus Dojkabacteria bacterium]|jgi:ribosome recycling factor